jgi:hypothetical protein
MGMNKEKMMVEVHGLNADYGLYIGQLIAEGVTGEQLDPTHYLEEYMNMHETPPYEVCCGFLLQFMEYDSVSEWLNQFPWDDEEEESYTLEIWGSEIDMVEMWAQNEIERSTDAIRTLEHAEDMALEVQIKDTAIRIHRKIQKLKGVQ